MLCFSSLQPDLVAEINENHGAQPAATDNASALPPSAFKVSGSACLTRSVGQKLMKPFTSRLLAATGGLALVLIGYNLIFAPKETNGHESASVTTWMLDASRKDIELPTNITEHEISNSSYWRGFGDFEVIIQIKCDATTVRKYRSKCIERFLKSEKEEVPEKFRNVDYSIQFDHVMPPSVGYKILFSDSDDSSILIRTVKS